MRPFPTTTFADTVYSSPLMFIDVYTRLGQTRSVPVEKHCSSVRTIKTHQIAVVCLALGFGLNTAVVTTTGVEGYVVGAHHVVQNLASSRAREYPRLISRNLSQAQVFVIVE